MGDQHHREGVSGQVALQPVPGRQIEVVGRLIEQQQIRPLQQQPRQGDAHLPAAGEMFAGLVPISLGKAQTAQHLGDFHLHGVAAALAEGFLQHGVTLHGHGAVAAGDFLLQLGQLGFDRQQRRQGRAGFGKQRPSAVGQTILGQIAEGRPLGELELATIRLNLTGQHPQQGGFAGAIFTAQADTIARADMPVDAGKDFPAAKILVYFSQLQHGACYSTTAKALKP